MALQRETAGAECVGARLHIAVGEEFPVFRAADGALGAPAPVEQPGHGYGPSRDPLQHGARDVVEGPADHLFHDSSTLFTFSSALRRRALHEAISSVARLTSAARPSTSISSLRRRARIFSISAIASV